MNEAVKQLRQKGPPFQADGIAVECGPDGIRVDTGEGVFLAHRALSCLIEPIAGDRVLVAGDLSTDIFVIAVLERRKSSPIRISVNGDLAVGVTNGRFAVAAAHGIDLVSAGDLGLTAAEFTVRAPEGHLFFGHLSYLGHKIFAQIEGMKLVGGFLDAVLERISHKVKRSYRVVEELDLVRSEQIDYRAAKNMSLRGQNALVTAKDLVKIDGDQIHLG
jgi:hypothetical protein